jgi:hypothetical protein
MSQFMGCLLFNAPDAQVIAFLPTRNLDSGTFRHGLHAKPVIGVGDNEGVPNLHLLPWVLVWPRRTWDRDTFFNLDAHDFLLFGGFGTLYAQ